MAKTTKFGSKSKPKKENGISFDFGFNALSKREKRAYNRKHGKSGHKPGGGS